MAISVIGCGRRSQEPDAGELVDHGHSREQGLKKTELQQVSFVTEVLVLNGGFQIGSVLPAIEPLEH